MGEISETFLRYRNRYRLPHYNLFYSTLAHNLIILPKQNNMWSKQKQDLEYLFYINLITLGWNCPINVIQHWSLNLKNANANSEFKF